MNLDIQVTEGEEQTHVALSGEVDVYTASKLKETLNPLAEQEGQVLVVDLSEIDYIDSTGLGIFIGTLKITEKSNSELRLTGLNERVKRLFEITGLNEVIDIEAEKREEA
ncbi:STAS domain-containing protein [Salisediminibacterium halotolerans]|uniref:Anti-sigma factor antagonist n=1 Tax=Salisediminibacterium halotolerans TaxID=517425 RepID=A0A1H9SPN0_9BACI|nr:STAS domain-containing protein [Salisediminibacterium haloalkalitolerans]SER86960.1 anti-sigma B factor antagonist [Salisediminibacterium haloalkalitolerans]